MPFQARIQVGRVSNVKTVIAASEDVHPRHRTTMTSWTIAVQAERRKRNGLSTRSARSRHHSPATREACARAQAESSGAEGGTRTPTVLLPPAPQAGEFATRERIDSHPADR